MAIETTTTSPRSNDPNAVEHELNRLIKPDLRVCYKQLDGVQNGGCFLDVFGPTVPVDGPVPVMLYAHGGGFTVGASVSIPFRQVRWLREHGIAVASVEYRMLPHVKLPDIRQDGLDAYRFVQTNLNSQLTAANLRFAVDGTRVGAWGASAGGTFILLLTADILADPTLPPLRVLIPNYPGAVFIDGPESGTPEDVEKLRKGNKQFDDAFKLLEAAPCSTGATRPFNRPLPQGLKAEAGTDSFVNDIFDVRPTGDTVSDQLRAARVVFIDTMITSNLFAPLLLGPPPYAQHSPLSHLTPAYPPTYIIVAGNDGLLPQPSMDALTDRLRELDVEVVIGVCPGMKHGHVEALPHQGPWPEGNEWWEQVVLPSLEFMAKRLGVEIE